MPVGKASWPIVAAYRLQRRSVTWIARELGVSAAAVSSTLSHPEFAPMLEEEQRKLIADIRLDIVRGAKVGVDSMIRLASGEPAVNGGEVVLDEETGRPIYTVPHNVQGKASMDLATLAGLKETTINITGDIEAQVRNSFTGLTTEQIRDLIGEDDDHS